MQRSFWKVQLTSGKVIHELHADWFEDVVRPGHSAHIATLSLITPDYTVKMDITHPWTAFQFKRGTYDLFSGERVLEAHIIGCVEDLDTGACRCAIWDAKHGTLLPDFETSVKAFGSWHEDIIAVGALNLDVIGVKRP